MPTRKRLIIISAALAAFAVLGVAVTALEGMERTAGTVTVTPVLEP
jgi:hypothetical protein